MNITGKKKIIWGMMIMLLAVILIFGGIFGYKAFQERAVMNAMKAQKAPPVTVTAGKAAYETWQPELRAVGSLRAVRGVDVTSEIAGLIRTVSFQPGEEVRTGRLLVELNDDADRGQLRVLEAAAELAQIVYDRDKKQFAVQAISRATLDADTADLKAKRAQVVQQTAIVEKKTIRAPFAGRLGVSNVNPGQYVNPGDKIVTLQALDAIYIDFYLPQQELSRISSGWPVAATTDTYPGRIFHGRVTTVNPKVDPDTRNVLVEATFSNPRHELLPGMYASVVVQTGARKRYLTLPQTAITYNPYGTTLFIVEETKQKTDGSPSTVRQVFVTVGGSRGDQVAILKGIKEGDLVVTSGQFKLKSGSSVIIDNKVQPKNDAAPTPEDQ
jgi:membrane fusion protein, multidrug efflux system